MYPKLGYVFKNYRLFNFGEGIKIDQSENKIPDSFSPDMLNMYYNGNVLRKREGQLMLFNDNDILACAKETFYNFFIYHSGDKIKAYNYETKEITVLLGKLKREKGTFFLYNGYMYYIGTGEYYVISYKDNILSCEIVDGYIPTVLINCDETSVGDTFEEYNYLTNAFKYTYNTNVNTSAIQLPNVPLDREKEIKVTFNSRIISNYRINWDTGFIIIDDELSDGHNLLEITFYSCDTGDRNKITDCKVCEAFGGLNSGISEGTRMIVAGNKNFKTTFFYSELKDPTYFPVNQFEILGDDNDPITCAGKQYNALIFFKKKSIYISYYSYLNGEVNFTVSKLNSNIGCDCPYTLETIDNQLVWLNSMWGVMTLYSTNIKDEKNVRCISYNINGQGSNIALLSQKNLESSVGFVNRGKFYLVTDIYSYVLNISNNFNIGLNSETMSWYLMDNIKATDYIYHNKEIYLASDKGFSYFKDILYDFFIDNPINCYIKTKAIDFNNPEFFKTIFDLSFSLKALNNSYFKLELFDENGSMGKEYEYYVNKFNFKNFGFLSFTFLGNLFSFVIKRRIARRRTKYLMIKFSNNKANSQMSIADINITYRLERSTKYSGI